ncbi:hypothetical protein LEP1GSC058_2828 [Leptospira fainei serovar Hurstbridge str. BUT 6]|uniref:Uncharacterized protein n=1 Tax=Leptospira fainei serovar Hurstbridge str. BUT 6 TaxID=1193011 RepID=S3UVE0_9LEPT|nr:hypothetical protein [Leptospira fainei]EPG74366.1 hypothetical protein LEP1GSC058_2828 [Leptospira fainei serovar Hurstbridge str. BUT 6]
MKKLSIILFLAISSVADCQSLEKTRTRELAENFKELLRERKVLIRQIVPPKFSPVPVDPEVLFRYDYALKSVEAGIEIRYTIYSIPAYLKKLAEFKKNNPDAVIAPPKKNDYIPEFIMNLQNLAGTPENIFSSKPFPENAVKDEFGADWGSNSYLELNPTYDKNYKYCSLVVIHKDNVADVYIFYLSKDKDKLVKFLKETHLFYNLRFL